MTSRPSIKEISKGLSAMHEEGQGVWQVEVNVIPDIVRAVLTGDTSDKTSRLYQCALNLGACILAHAKTAPQLCLTCDTKLVGKDAFPPLMVTFGAHVDQPSVVSVQAVCRNCVARHSRPEMDTKIVAAIAHYTGMTDMRMLRDIHGAGTRQ